MSLGIDEVKKVLSAAVDAVNAEQKLASANFVLAGQQLLDADEAELQSCVEDINKLDLSNDALEAKIKAYADAGAKPLAFVLKLIKIFFPKIPTVVPV